MIELKDNNQSQLTLKNKKSTIGEKLEISLKDYKAKSQNNIFLSFFQDEEKRNLKNEDGLIVCIKKNGDNYLGITGNYVGRFAWNGLEIEIKSRFTDTFLQRMLNFANDIFLDDISIIGQKVDKSFDISKYIIYYLFVQSLKKAFLLGLPKIYKSISHHDMKLKGSIDINNFIKYDIPFQGKISSISREQKEAQEVIDTLYKAIKIIEENNKNFTKSILYIKTHLKQYKSKNYVSNETINRAINSKTLQNPIFASYKKVLEYAKFIINANSIEEKASGYNETFGFIINVAELFEIYITKLLQKEFSDWLIESQKIKLYESQFFKRKIIPDIVMQKGDNVLVFDTKYKKMTMQGKNQNGAGDVDRNGFFQINTYMSYYKQQGNNVLVGGLLYPMEKFERERCHAQNWFGNDETKFIVDGIDVSGFVKEKSETSILQKEQEFISNIKALLG